MSTGNATPSRVGAKLELSHPSGCGLPSLPSWFCTRRISHAGSARRHAMTRAACRADGSYRSTSQPIARENQSKIDCAVRLDLDAHGTNAPDCIAAR
eukprot:2189101-Prymnesium_polylepis.1